MLSAKTALQTPKIDDFWARHWVGLCDFLQETVMFTLKSGVQVMILPSSNSVPHHFTACSCRLFFAQLFMVQKHRPHFLGSLLRCDHLRVPAAKLGYRYLTLTVGLQLVGFCNCSCFKILLEVCLKIWCFIPPMGFSPCA
jgi:hypothetical protein